MKSTLFILLASASFACFAEVLPNIEAARGHTDKVMGKVGAGDIEAGLKLIKPYSVVPPAEFDAMIGQSILQLPIIIQRFGKASGMEFIEQDKVGESLVKFVYISKYERHAMRWNFYLYKGPQGWVINTFKFDDQIHEIFPH